MVSQYLNLVRLIWQPLFKDSIPKCYYKTGISQYSRPKSKNLIHNQTVGRFRLARGPALVPTVTFIPCKEERRRDKVGKSLTFMFTLQFLFIAFIHIAYIIEYLLEGVPFQSIFRLIFIPHCMKRTQNKIKIVQWRLLE